MSEIATTVEEYIENLPDDRRDAISEVREAIVENLPEGIEETINWGMISYEVPLAVYPDTYNGKPLMFAALASQKSHMAVYLSSIYADEEQSEWFRSAYEATGKKMDVGKSCVRFNKLENLPVELVGEAIGRVSLEDFLAKYEDR